MILFVVIYSPRTPITFHQNDNHNDYYICFEQRARRPAGISVWRAVISVILYFHSSGVRLSGQVKETSRGHFYSAYSSFSHHHLSLVHVRVGITYFLPLLSNLLSEKYYKNSFLWGKYHKVNSMLHITFF